MLWFGAKSGFGVVDHANGDESFGFGFEGIVGFAKVVVVLLLVVLPEFFGAEAEAVVLFGSVPKDLVFEFVAFGAVVDDETAVVFGDLVHDLAKHVVGGEHAAEGVEQAFAILLDVVAHDEHVIDIGAEGGWDAEHVLQGEDPCELEMAAVLGDVADLLVVDPFFGLVHEIVHDENGARVDLLGFGEGDDFALAFGDAIDDAGFVSAVDEEGRDEFGVEGVALFGAGDGGDHGIVAVMVEEIFDAETFAGFLLADPDDIRGFRDSSHIKFA